MENQEIYFTGSSRLYYPFLLSPLDTALPDIGGVYIYIRKYGGSCDVLYVGQVDTFAGSIPNYEKRICISKGLVNYVCVHFENDIDVRIQMVNDFISFQQGV